MFPSRLLIVEYLCAGFVGLQDVSQSMLNEGWAMLSALLQDASRIDGLSVTTLWNLQLGDPPTSEVGLLSTTSPCMALREWRRALNETDDVYVIAPETDGILKSLCDEALASGKRVLNCTPDAIEASGDKWETFLRCTAAGVPTIQTQLLEDVRKTRSVNTSPTGWVVKPRYGCGSEGIHLITDLGDLKSMADLPEMIIQPFVPGEPASVAAMFDDDGHLGEIFPVAIQRLTRDLRYVSGCIPAVSSLCGVDPDLDQISEMLQALARSFPGLRGYVGIDLLIQQSGKCVVVEINPRLTTSYIGYRRLTKANLSERWLSIGPNHRRPIKWEVGFVSFAADGAVAHG